MLNLFQHAEKINFTGLGIPKQVRDDSIITFEIASSKIEKKCIKQTVFLQQPQFDFQSFYPHYQRLLKQ